MISYPTHQAPRPAIRVHHVIYILSRIGALIAGLLLLGALALVWASGSPIFSAPAAALALMLICMLGLQLRDRRRIRAQLVLQHLANAVQLRLPLPPYLRAAAQGESAGVRRRLLRMATFLEHGATCGTAFHLATGELELRIAGRIDAAQDTGHLSTTLAQLTQSSQATQPRTGIDAASLSYMMAVILTTALAVLAIALFVMPKYQMIMRDFNVTPPLPMRVFLQISPLLMSLMLVILAISALIILTHSTRLLISSRQMPVLYRGLVDRIRWYTPLLKRLTRDLSYADLAWTLSGALRAGHSLDFALSVQIRAGINRVLRGQLVKMRASLLGGADAASAANDANLPPLLCSLLKQDAQPDLAKAMAFAGRAYSARHGRLLVALQAALPVAMTLAVASLVTGLALALFVPMIKLIDAMAPAFRGIQ